MPVIIPEKRILPAVQQQNSKFMKSLRKLVKKSLKYVLELVCVRILIKTIIIINVLWQLLIIFAPIPEILHS